MKNGSLDVADPEILTWKSCTIPILTLYVLNFQSKQKHVFTCHFIPPDWLDTDGWNLSSCNTRTYLFYKVIIMAQAAGWMPSDARNQGTSNRDIYFIEPG